MTPAHPGPRTDRWLRATSWLVPVAARREWLAEWRAEMASLRRDSRGRTRRPGRLEWTRAAAGALPDALWHLFDEWSPESMWHDLRHALRALRSRVSVTFLAVFVLGLGLGAALVVVSVVDAVLLRPLPFDEPERLVQVWETNPTKGWYQETAAPANALDWRDSAESFDDMALYGSWISDQILEIGGEPRAVESLAVGPRFFDVLGVPLFLGRPFPDDVGEAQGTSPVILSHAFWQQSFGADPAILDETIEVAGGTLRVIGVGPPGFEFPSAVDLWTPLAWPAESRQKTWFRRAHFVRVVGRLAPGVTVDEARAELATLAARLEREYPETNTDMGTGVTPLHKWVVGESRRPIELVAAAVTLLLLVACTNVASLLLLRAAGRRREMALRSALGAGRSRLIRLLVLEGLLLAVAAGFVALIFARLGLDVLVRLAPEVPRLTDAALDQRMVAAALVLTAAVAVVFSVIPAVLGSRVDLRRSLPSGAARRSGHSSEVRARRWLVVGEVAMAMVMIVGAGLLWRSLESLYEVDPGFATEGILAVEVNAPRAYYADARAVETLYDRLAERAAALPGVVAVGQSGRLPIGSMTWTSDFALQGTPGFGVESRHLEIDPGYVEAAGLRLLAGRGVSPDDDEDGRAVVLVSRSVAEQVLPGQKPREILGRRICESRECGDESELFTVVGVVEDTRFDGLAEEPVPMTYHPLAQSSEWNRELLLRVAGDAGALRESVAAILRETDPRLPVMEIRTLRQVIDQTLARERFLAALLGAFGGLALLLAIVGTYGVLATTVELRRREIGIRAALGARRGQLEIWVVRQGLILVGLGAAAGLGLAALAGRFVESQLFAVDTHDPLTYAVAAGLLLATGTLAAWLPARRAARVDPVESLRSE